MTSPNVIVFFTDQQRWDTAGLHGNPLDLMPNFDLYAQRGTHVAHSFTCQPVCGPARATLQTGMYASRTGCWRNSIVLDPRFTTLADCFGEAGYRTGYIGKWHLGSRRDIVPAEERGRYDYWLGANALEFTSNYNRTVVYDGDNRKVRLPGNRVDALTDAAIRFIDANQDRPFYLFLSHLEPHFQNHVDDYPAPPGYRERYTGRWTPPDLAALGGTSNAHLGGYYGMVKRLDEAYGRLMDALESLGLLDNTIVLFTADHGCHFKTRNAEYKRSCHESSIRVPTSIHGPGFEAGGSRPELVSLVDLPPTLLDGAGLPVPEQMDGHSLVPRLRRDGDWPDDVFIQITTSGVGRAVRTRRWKYAVHADESDGAVPGTADAYREAFLYDLQHDPHELTNLIESEAHTPIRTDMRARLQRYINAVEDAEPEIIQATTQKSGQRRVLDDEPGS